MNLKYSSSKKKFLNLIYFLITSLILLTSCQNNFKNIVGKTYIYEDSAVTLTVGFDKDTMYYIMKDFRKPNFYRSKYQFKKLNDTSFIIEVPVKPPFWDKNTWEIIVNKNTDGFYSKESGKYYKIYADSMLIKKGF